MVMVASERDFASVIVGKANALPGQSITLLLTKVSHINAAILIDVCLRIKSFVEVNIDAITVGYWYTVKWSRPFVCFSVEILCYIEVLLAEVGNV